MTPTSSALDLARRAFAFGEARFSALHKLMALAVALAIPLALVGWMSWSAAQDDIVAAERKIEALAFADQTWRVMAEIGEAPSGVSIDGPGIREALEGFNAAADGVAPSLSVTRQTDLWRTTLARPGATRAKALNAGSTLIGDISNSAGLNVDGDRATAWSMWILTLRLPQYLAAAENARGVALKSGAIANDPAVWKALGGFEDISDRTLSAVGRFKTAAGPAATARIGRSADRLAFASQDLNAKAHTLMTLGPAAQDPALRAAAVRDMVLAEQEAAFAANDFYKHVTIEAHRLLETRLASVKSDQRNATMLVLLVLGLACLLATGIAHSIVAPQRRLARTMEGLVKGNIDIDVPFRNYPHDLGDVANVVEVFRQTLIARKTLEFKIETERSALEKRVADRTRALEAANAEKSRFVALLSHEIRTPLNGVLGMAGALSRTPLEPSQKEMLRVITASGDVLLRLLNNAIDITRIEAGSFELEMGVFDLTEMVDTASALYREGARAKGLSFDMTIAPNAAGSYHGDGVRLRQIVQNFVANAVKFTESGGVRVHVARRGEADGRVLLRLDVEDTGIGLPKNAAHLFQRFSQGEISFARRYGGAGLGLAICRELAELMDATVSALPREDGGAIFRLDVALEAAAIADADPSAAESKDVWANVRVLAADDNAMNRLVLKTLLAQAGVDVHIVEDGVDAVEAARAIRFDLILLDLHMPGLDGQTATRTIRTLSGPNQTTPILALTADTLPAQIEACFAAGMNGHVSKPIQVQALFTALADALAVSPQTEQARLAAG